MTYLDYINQFHRVRRHSARRLTSNAADLYFHLLAVANSVGWKASFNESTGMLLAALNMTDKTLDGARRLLIEVGLLGYTPGKKGTTSAYQLLTVGQDSSPDATEIFRSNGEGNGGESGGEMGDLHKNKIKNNTGGADAPGECAKNLKPKAAASPAKPKPVVPEPEPWLVWLLANAPRVQQLKNPLTAEQWAALLADFGDEVLHDALAGMENHEPLLRKYRSANLTARDWCKRRAAGQPPRPPAPPPTAAPTPKQNEEFQAQREAAAQAAEDAHFAKYATA